MDLVYFIVIGLVAGFLAGKLTKGSGFGAVGDIVVGVLGAIVGGWLFPRIGVSFGGDLIGRILLATFGAIVLLFVLRLVKLR